MDVLRRAANPWGEEVLLGIGWDLFWLAVAAGVAFVVIHTVLVLRLQKRSAGASLEAPSEVAGVPERVVRHTLASRLFHWSMAVTMFALLITAFVPVMGLQFDWVTIHWIAGLALIATVIYHIVHAVFFKSLMAVWVGIRDVREGTRELMGLLGLGPRFDGKAGKYPVGNKLYHHGAAVATLVAVASGLLMMVRIDTPLFAQNQYMLSDVAWGIVYVLHGVSGVTLVLMVISHVYFAVRPEKWWQTRSMIRGWITREEYLTHHDPALWAPPGVAPGGAEERRPEVAAPQETHV